MAKRTSGASTGRQGIAELHEQVARLTAIIEWQQQKVTQQEQRIEQQQVEIDALREARSTAAPKENRAASRASGRSTNSIGRRQASSRRALLKGAGVAAAAASVALVASEHPAHAARADDGGNFILGQANTATSQTSLTATVTSSASPFVNVDASSSTTNNAVAIQGISNVQYGTGVQGITSGSGTGVFGSSGSGGNGVSGAATGSGSAGVVGHSDGGFGVWGIAGGGTALVGWGVIDLATGTPGVVGSGRIYQGIRTTPGAPTGSGTTYSAGESIRDSNGDLWLCVSGGAPGTWVKAAHAEVGLTGGAISNLPHPIRLLDTRNIGDAYNNGTGAPLAYNGSSPSFTLQVTGDIYGGVTVPSDAVAAVGNLTVVATAAGGGYVALVPAGAGFQGTSNINYAASQIIANFFNVGLSSGGAIDIYVGGFPTQVIIDLFAVVS